MLKYSQIDLPLSRACGARTDVTGRLEQTRLAVLYVSRPDPVEARATRPYELAACKALAVLRLQLQPRL